MRATLRLAFRQLRKAPGFSLTAVLTLALAIGANAIVFSVLNALVLLPLNVPNPGNLFMVERNYGSETTLSQSYPDYRDLRDRNRSFDSLVIYDIMGGVGLDTGKGNPSVVWPYMVSGNYFGALGIQPYLGRFIHASEEHGKNSMPEIVLSYALWHSYFNGNRDVIGRVVQINKHPFMIIGVAPADFRGTELFFAPDLWAPIVNLSQVSGGDYLEERGNHSAWVIGRLKPNVTPEAATADLNTIANSLAKAYPKDDDGLKFSLSHPGLAGNTLGRPTRAFMAGRSCCLPASILLAACANLGSLFSARAADRAREIGSPDRSGIASPADPAPNAHRGASGICGRGHLRYGGAAIAISACAQHVAAYSRHPDQCCSGESRCQDVHPCTAPSRHLQRFVLRSNSRPADAAHQSLADHPFRRRQCDQLSPLLSA